MPADNPKSDRRGRTPLPRAHGIAVLATVSAMLLACPASPTRAVSDPPDVQPSDPSTWTPARDLDHWGFRRADGTWAIDPTWTQVQPFGPDGVALAADARSWWCIDARARRLAHVGLRGVAPERVVDGRRRVRDPDGRMHWIDAGCRRIGEHAWDFLDVLSGGVAVVCEGCETEDTGDAQARTGGRWGFVGADGYPIGDVIYEHATPAASDDGPLTVRVGGETRQLGRDGVLGPRIRAIDVAYQGNDAERRVVAAAIERARQTLDACAESSPGAERRRGLRLRVLFPVENATAAELDPPDDPAGACLANAVAMALPHPSRISSQPSARSWVDVGWSIGPEVDADPNAPAKPRSRAAVNVSEDGVCSWVEEFPCAPRKMCMAPETHVVPCAPWIDEAPVLVAGQRAESVRAAVTERATGRREQIVVTRNHDRCDLRVDVRPAPDAAVNTRRAAIACHEFDLVWRVASAAPLGRFRPRRLRDDGYVREVDRSWSPRRRVAIEVRDAQWDGRAENDEALMAVMAHLFAVSRPHDRHAAIAPDDDVRCFAHATGFQPL